VKNESIVKIKLSELILDPVLKVRDINPGPVGHYAELLKIGGVFKDPILIDNKNRIVDGRMRFKAYIQQFDLNTEVDCIVSKFTKKEDLIIEAIKMNVAHGCPFTTIEKKDLVLKLKSFKYDEKFISTLFGVTGAKITTWQGFSIITTFPNGTKEIVPVKTGIPEKLLGTEIPNQEVEEHRQCDSGKEVYFHANYLTNLIARGEGRWIPFDDKTNKSLLNLKIQLDEYLQAVGLDVNMLSELEEKIS
jgi:hypothetical protein